MKTRLLAAALIAFGAPIIASAQCNPASYLVGKTFAFRVSGSPSNGRIAAIGTFTAYPGGYLAVTETVVDNTGSVAYPVLRTAPASGRWMVDATCSTGMLQIMMNREFFSFTFTVSPDGTQLTLTGRDESNPAALAPVQGSSVTGCVGGGNKPPTPGCSAPGPQGFGPPTDPAAITGIARLNPPTSCPIGLGNPNLILKGTQYAYTLSGSGFTETGTFVPSFLNPAAYSGDLTIMNRTINTIPGVAPGINMPFMPNYNTQGRYIVYPDCSGGEFMFMANGYSVQVEFVFSRADFSEVFLNTDGGRGGAVYAGTGTRE